MGCLSRPFQEQESTNPGFAYQPNHYLEPPSTFLLNILGHVKNSQLVLCRDASNAFCKTPVKKGEEAFIPSPNFFVKEREWWWFLFLPLFFFLRKYNLLLLHPAQWQTTHSLLRGESGRGNELFFFLLILQNPSTQKKSQISFSPSYCPGWKVRIYFRWWAGLEAPARGNGAHGWLEFMVTYIMETCAKDFNIWILNELRWLSVDLAAQIKIWLLKP